MLRGTGRYKEGKSKLKLPKAKFKRLGTPALYLCLTQHIMQQRAADLCGTPTHQLQAKHTRRYADMMLLKRRALAVASANHVAAPTEVTINLSRLEKIIIVHSEPPAY